jgi:hypothetical protein
MNIEQRRVIIPTLDEIVTQNNIRQISFDVYIGETGGTESIFGSEYSRDGTSKILARYERWLANSDVSVRFGSPIFDNLHEDSAHKEVHVLGDRDIISGLYAVHLVLKKDPLARNVFAEVDGLQMDQLKFSAGVKYAARIGLPNPEQYLVRVIASGKKNYKLR